MVEMMVSVLTWLGLACWVVCLWWMHRRSSSHGRLLSHPPGTNKGIEPFSPEERDATANGPARIIKRGSAKGERLAPEVRVDPEM